MHLESNSFIGLPHAVQKLKIKMLLDFWTVHFHFEYRDLPKGHPPINRPLDYLADKTVSQKCYNKKKKNGNPAL